MSGRECYYLSFFLWSSSLCAWHKSVWNMKKPWEADGGTYVLSASRASKQGLLKAKLVLQQWSTAGLMVRFPVTPHISPITKSTCTNESWNSARTLKLEWCSETWLSESDYYKFTLNFTQKNPCTRNMTLCAKKSRSWGPKWQYI